MMVRYVGGGQYYHHPHLFDTRKNKELDVSEEVANALRDNNLFKVEKVKAKEKPTPKKEDPKEKEETKK